MSNRTNRRLTPAECAILVDAMFKDHARSHPARPPEPEIEPAKPAEFDLVDAVVKARTTLSEADVLSLVASALDVVGGVAGSMVRDVAELAALAALAPHPELGAATPRS